MEAPGCPADRPSRGGECLALMQGAPFASRNCTSRFYAFDFLTFEQAFPGLRSCAFSTYGHVIDEVTRLLPQPCRTATPAEADFIFPPPYFFHDHNWPFYCKRLNRELTSAWRDGVTYSLVLSENVVESSDLTSDDWSIDMAGAPFRGARDDKRCRFHRVQVHATNNRTPAALSRALATDRSSACTHQNAFLNNFSIKPCRLWRICS